MNLLCLILATSPNTGERGGGGCWGFVAKKIKMINMGIKKKKKKAFPSGWRSTEHAGWGYNQGRGWGRMTCLIDADWLMSLVLLPTAGYKSEQGLLCWLPSLCSSLLDTVAWEGGVIQWRVSNSRNLLMRPNPSDFTVSFMQHGIGFFCVSYSLSHSREKTEAIWKVS